MATEKTHDEIIEDTTTAEEMTLNELSYVGGGAGSDTFQ